ncbi:uncharacterized protein LOC117102707 isoform X2 [Anneissia japonica]|uniref:uncharacterized protein LOC117102707 isoform X2 n=1 Tax=Anneissia japonica TaxID=1529436 RepID=UPI00142550E9|nr:uncharacterized protein LOC117102707 isoform X2 [Anneissia japonica]
MSGPTTNSTPSADVGSPIWKEHRKDILLISAITTMITGIAGILFYIAFTICDKIEERNEESQQVDGSPNTTTNKSWFQKHKCSVLPAVIAFFVTVCILFLMAWCCIRRGYNQVANLVLSCPRRVQERIVVELGNACCNQGNDRDAADQGELQPLDAQGEEDNDITRSGRNTNEENITISSQTDTNLVSYILSEITRSGRNTNEENITNSSQTDTNLDNEDVSGRTWWNTFFLRGTLFCISISEITRSGRNTNEENITISSQTDTNLDNQDVSTEAVGSQEEGSRRVRTISSESQPYIEEGNVNGTLMAVSGSSHQGGEGDTRGNVNSHITRSGRNSNEENITFSSQTDTNLDNPDVSTEAVVSQEEGSRRVRTISSESLEPCIEEGNVNGTLMAVSGSSHQGGEGDTLGNVNSHNQDVSTAAVGSQEEGSRRVRTISSESQPYIEEGNVNGTLMAVSGSSHQGGEGDTLGNVNSHNVNETRNVISDQEGEGDNGNVESRFTYDFFIISNNENWKKNTLKKLEERKKRNGKNMQGFYDKRDIRPGEIRQTAVINALKKSKACVIGYMKVDITDHPLYITVMQQELLLEQKEYRRGRLIPVKTEKDSVIPDEIGNVFQVYDGWESDAVDILYKAIESISDFFSF